MILYMYIMGKIHRRKVYSHIFISTIIGITISMIMYIVMIGTMTENKRNDKYALFSERPLRHTQNYICIYTHVSHTENNIYVHDQAE